MARIVHRDRRQPERTATTIRSVTPPGRLAMRDAVAASAQRRRRPPLRRAVHPYALPPGPAPPGNSIVAFTGTLGLPGRHGTLCCASALRLGAEILAECWTD
jgi:hypothetical protein